jgi:bifunctional DNA-binding transcriptional regulator/antitoxin component of YhaV-PrlF toxin-antitoxin module
MTKNSPSTFLKLSPQGRLVIPAAMRHLLGFELGSSIEAQIQGDSLVLKPQASGLTRFTARFEAVNRQPRSRKMSDELIADRRKAALLESA